MRKLIKNCAQCLDCNEIIESKHRHDHVTCKCFSPDEDKGIFIDGGTDYMRSGAYDLTKFKDLSVWEGEADPTPSIVPGKVKDMVDEWILVDDGILPKTGDPVLIYDPLDHQTPYVVAKYSDEMKEWTCAHCQKSKLNPKMWKFINN